MSLFSYFSSRKKFGVVANNNRRIKDLYLIPLGSKDPLPSRLLPFDGPGKHLEGIIGILLLFKCCVVFVNFMSNCDLFMFFKHTVSIFSLFRLE